MVADKMGTDGDETFGLYFTRLILLIFVTEESR